MRSRPLLTIPHLVIKVVVTRPPIKPGPYHVDFAFPSGYYGGQAGLFARNVHRIRPRIASIGGMTVEYAEIAYASTSGMSLLNPNHVNIILSINGYLHPR
jgi:hypothetical protein